MHKYGLWLFIIFSVTGTGNAALAQIFTTAVTNFGTAAGAAIITQHFTDSGAVSNSTVSGDLRYFGTGFKKNNSTLMNGGVVNKISEAQFTVIANAVTGGIYNYQNSHAATELTNGTLSSSSTGLLPGVYHYSGNLTTSQKVVLNDGGDKNAVFIFEADNNLAVPFGSSVVMSSGGPGNNVFWLVRNDVNIFGNTVGNIYSYNNLNIGPAVTITGKLISSFNIRLGGNDSINVFKDTDKDGVSDNLDDYPLDPTRAFNNFTTTSTIAFEDSWPYQGDYDMNDLVINYNYQIITNSRNAVVQVIGRYILMATGGGQNNGFGVSFPVLASSVGLVSAGTQEAGQTNAVFILFSNMHNEESNWNTIPGQPVSAFKKYTLNFNVLNGPLLVDFGLDGYDPFLFNFKLKKRLEVHLSGKQPTSLGNLDLFKTGNDNSVLGTDATYVSKTGMPWAITFPSTSFNYMVEGYDISTGYLHFPRWATSSGTEFSDWYFNLQTGYRDKNRIYTK